MIMMRSELWQSLSEGFLIKAHEIQYLELGLVCKRLDEIITNLVYQIC